MVASRDVYLGFVLNHTERVEAFEILTNLNVVSLTLVQAWVVLPNHTFKLSLIGFKVRLNCSIILFAHELVSPSSREPFVFISLRHLHPTNLLSCKMICQANIHEKLMVDWTARNALEAHSQEETCRIRSWVSRYNRVVCLKTVYQSTSFSKRSKIFTHRDQVEFNARQIFGKLLVLSNYTTCDKLLFVHYSEGLPCALIINPHNFTLHLTHTIHSFDCLRHVYFCHANITVVALINYLVL